MMTLTNEALITQLSLQYQAVYPRYQPPQIISRSPTLLAPVLPALPTLSVNHPTILARRRTVSTRRRRCQPMAPRSQTDSHIIGPSLHVHIIRHSPTLSAHHPNGQHPGLTVPNTIGLSRRQLAVPPYPGYIISLPDNQPVVLLRQFLLESVIKRKILPETKALFHYLLTSLKCFLPAIGAPMNEDSP